MSSELVYTSSARGLNPNTSGFCTVAATQGLSRPTQARLESLSGYEFRFNLSDPKASMNPANFAHTRLAVGAETRSILSRIAFSGADYSGRTNKIAHHFVLDAGEQMAAGPAWMLAQMTAGVWQTEWTDEPQSLPKRRLDALLAGGQPPAGPAVAWQKAAGDAGWAGVLAKAYVDNSDVPAFVLFNPGTDLLPLFQESLAVLPPAERWNVCFATYYTVLPAGCQYHWRGVLAGSAAHQEIKRFAGATVIDLTGPLPAAETNEFTEAARAGRTVESRRGGPARPASAGAGRPSSAPAALAVGGGDGDDKIRLADVGGSEETPRPSPPRVPLRPSARAARPSSGLKVVLGAVVALLVVATAVMGWQIGKARDEVADLKNEKEALTGAAGKSGTLARQVTTEAKALQTQAAEDARAAEAAAQRAERAVASDDPKKMDAIEQAIRDARSAAMLADRSARDARRLSEILGDAVGQTGAKDAKIAADGAWEQAALAGGFAEKAAACRNTAVAMVNPLVTPTKGPDVPVKNHTSPTPTASSVTPTKGPDPAPADVAMTAPKSISRDEYKAVVVAPTADGHVMDYAIEDADIFVEKPPRDTLPPDLAGIELKYADKQLKVSAASASGLGTGAPLATCRVVGTPGKHVLRCTLDEAGKSNPKLKWFVLEVADSTRKILYQCPLADRPKAAEKTLDVGFRKGPYRIGVWNRDSRNVDFQDRQGTVMPAQAGGLSFSYPWPEKLGAFVTVDENADRRMRFDPRTPIDLESPDAAGARQLSIRVHVDAQASKETIELTPSLLALDRMKEIADQAWQGNWGANRAYLTFCTEELPKVNVHLEDCDKRMKTAPNDEEKGKIAAEKAGTEARKKSLEGWIATLEPQVAPSAQGVRDFMDAAGRVINGGALHMITVRDAWGMPVARMTLKFTPGDVDAYIWKQAPKNPVPLPPKGPDKGKPK